MVNITSRQSEPSLFVQQIELTWPCQVRIYLVIWWSAHRFKGKSSIFVISVHFAVFIPNKTTNTMKIIYAPYDSGSLICPFCFKKEAIKKHEFLDFMVVGPVHFFCRWTWPGSCSTSNSSWKRNLPSFVLCHILMTYPFMVAKHKMR